jgi:hypothetical protein
MSPDPEPDHFQALPGLRDGIVPVVVLENQGMATFSAAVNRVKRW